MTCIKCGGPLSHLNKSGFCVKNEECKQARRQANSARYYEKNKEQILARQNAKYKANPAPALATCAQYRANNRQKIRDAKRLYYYKMTTEQYDAVFEAQGGGCLGCKRTDVKLMIDHDHTCCSEIPTCGKCNRGLLCDRCNRAIGFIYEDPATLRALADYLERATCLKVP